MKGILKIGLGIVIGFACLGALLCGGLVLFGPAPPTPEGQPLPAGTTRPGPTSTPIPMGLTRANPASLGQPVVNDQRVECTVLSVERGVTLEFERPSEGTEFILITLRLRNLGPPDKTRRYNSTDFRVVGSRGVIYDRMFFLSTLDNALGSGEFFGGAEVTGKIVQEAGIGESDLILIWDPGPGSSARYLSVEP